MILFTTYFQSKNEQRQKEIDECLAKNFENKYISKIVLLNNKIFPNIPDKVEQVVINKSKDYRLKYSDAIYYINEHYRGEICILANSDIYFDDTLSKITDENIQGKMFALLRYETDGLHNRNDSQDSWIFKSPLPVEYKYITFSFGIPGCDSVFANRVYGSKVTVTNPCYDIHTHHLHESQERNYTERVKGVYLFIEPTVLEEDSKLSSAIFS
jgi:hypothetical protein